MRFLQPKGRHPKKQKKRDMLFELTILDKQFEQEKRRTQMEQLPEKARAYLDVLEADRQAALALSEQKALEAKLIEARQEGFRAAMQMLDRQIPTDAIVSSDHPKEPFRQRRTRRNIPKLITRELSFSGRAMNVRQIAKAIDYNLRRTNVTLQRMEETGEVIRNGKDGWESVNAG
jgi:hypothetical protein